jgi:hypothetical protein
MALIESPPISKNEASSSIDLTSSTSRHTPRSVSNSEDDLPRIKTAESSASIDVLAGSSRPILLAIMLGVGLLKTSLTVKDESGYSLRIALTNLIALMESPPVSKKLVESVVTLRSSTLSQISRILVVDD